MKKTRLELLQQLVDKVALDAIKAEVEVRLIDKELSKFSLRIGVQQQMLMRQRKTIAKAVMESAPKMIEVVEEMIAEEKKRK